MWQHIIIRVLGEIALMHNQLLPVHFKLKNLLDINKMKIKRNIQLNK
jgi:hypothetical protein